MQHFESLSVYQLKSRGYKLKNDHYYLEAQNTRNGPLRETIIAFHFKSEINILGLNMSWVNTFIFVMAIHNAALWSLILEDEYKRYKDQ